MADWYMKGQSNYDNSTGFHMGLYIDINGFDESLYDTRRIPNHIETQDPYMLFGAKTSPWLLGQKEVQIGLWGDHRIKIDTGGIWGWHTGSGVWVSLFGGGGGGVTQLSNLLDVNVVTYDDGKVLRADGVDYEAAFLDWGDLTNAPAGAVTAVEAADLVLTQGTLDMTPATGTPVNFNMTSSEDAWLDIEADVDNDDEAMHAWASFWQDQRARWLHIGVGEGANDNEGFIQPYEILNFYTGTLGAGVLKMSMSTTDLTMSIPIVMGSNAITFGGASMNSGSSPAGTTALEYNGYFYATRVYNAVYNDYADFWKANHGVKKKPGYCYSLEGKGLKITDKRADKACMGICSDTYGFATGQQYKGIPISIGGFLLSYVDREYDAGEFLVSNDKGILTKATATEVMMQLAIAKYMFKETKIKTKGIDVKGRHWVKVL